MLQEINSKRACEECGGDISHRSAKAKYCSRECRLLRRFRGTYCEYCGTELVIERQKVSIQKCCSHHCAQRLLFIKNNQGLNEDYFAAPNLENSYWAGFIAADGCVFRASYTRPILSIILKDSDGGHLTNFRYNVGGGRIDYGKSFSKKYNKTYYRVSYRVVSDKICDDLATNFNIHPRKSLTYNPPSLEGSLAHAFIAGYIDGDGCYYQTNGRPALSIEGTEQALSWINSIYDTDAKVTKQKNHFNARFYGNSAIQIRKSFQDLNLPLLDRKKNRWEELGLNLSLL